MLSTSAIALTLACASASPPAAPAPDTTRYTVLMAGRAAGFQSSWADPDGTLRYAFEFNDRGRGSQIAERLVLGSDGRPTRIELTGHDYFKNAVNERFDTQDGKAVWRSSSEHDSTTTPGYYVSVDGAPEETALLARALLAAPDGRLAVLPAGEARIEKVEELPLRATGDSTTASHYEIQGLGLSPTPIWLDRDGRFFAQGTSWFMVIRQGFESAAPDLIRSQDRYSARRGGELAARLARRPGGAVVFRNANLFDAASGRSRPHTTVVVRGDRIVAVGSDGRVAVPAGSETMDLAGHALLPGLWDMHVHINDGDGILQLAAGVTTVRDMGNDMEELLQRRRRFDAGELLGPRIIMAGLVDGPGPYTAPIKVVADDSATATAVVNRYADSGYVQLKIYSSVRPTLVPFLAAEAHRRGMRVSGHVPAFMTAEQAVRAGYDEIQHENFLFLNFWFDSVPDTRTPARFTAVAERAASLDLGSARVRAFVDVLRSHHTVLDPTINVFENLLVARKGAVDPGYAAVADRVPPLVRRGFLAGGLPVPEGKDQRYHDSFQTMLRFLKQLHDAGIPIVAGTDAFAGFALHRELELYVAAGIPAPEVLRIATLGAARVMKRDADLGSIAPGKQADLVVVDGDPARRIGDIRRVSLVMKGGTVFQPAQLYQAVGIRQPAGQP
ncbi:MAG TPA: amidohydrolase family protein [Gemmatimonadales bacterium]|nr:amidohydrolase family protein [Gemmatimonadales bacterium]